MEDRVAIFIDGSNLYHALRSNLGRYDLNFAEFTKKLCGARRLFRTYYYNVLQDPEQRSEALAALSWLRAHRWRRALM